LFVPSLMGNGSPCSLLPKGGGEGVGELPGLLYLFLGPFYCQKGEIQMCLLKGTVSRDFLLLVSQPQSIPLGPFQIFSKIRGAICSSRLTTGVVDTGGK
jgi:hypothetical protein